METIQLARFPTSIILEQGLCNMCWWSYWCRKSYMCSVRATIKTSSDWVKMKFKKNKWINKLNYIWFQRYFGGLYELILASFTKKNGLNRSFFDIEINNTIFHKICYNFWDFTAITRNKFNVMLFICWQSKTTVG